MSPQIQRSSATIEEAKRITWNVTRMSALRLPPSHPNTTVTQPSREFQFQVTVVMPLANTVNFYLMAVHLSTDSKESVRGGLAEDPGGHQLHLPDGCQEVCGEDPL